MIQSVSSVKERKTFMSSELSRNSAEVFKEADLYPVRISRRDGEPLVLMTAKANQEIERMLEIAGQLIGIALEEDDRSLGERFANKYEWMFALDPVDREACADELINAARAAFATKRAEILLREFASWEATAYAVADGLKPRNIEWEIDSKLVQRP